MRFLSRTGSNGTYTWAPVLHPGRNDIAHAVPLTLVAGIGHWATGAIDWHLIGVLLVGSLPGILLGSYCAHRLPETALPLVLAATLIVVVGKLASHELNSSSWIVTAITCVYRKLKHGCAPPRAANTFGVVAGQGPSSNDRLLIVVFISFGSSSAMRVASPKS